MSLRRLVPSSAMLVSLTAALLLPAALPSVLGGLQLGWSFAWGLVS